MLILQNLAFRLPDGRLLFDNLHLSIQKHEKLALVGANGSGKSSLLRFITGELQPGSGVCSFDRLAHSLYYVPQHFGQYNDRTVAELLEIAPRLQALKAILAGEGSFEDYSVLNDDWLLEEHVRASLDSWELPHLSLEQSVADLSGGEKTRVLLAGIQLNTIDLLLLDEPSNHLDHSGRERLYELLENTSAAVMVVSHDRQLLRRMDKIVELDKNGLQRYGGNYDFYAAQKEVEAQAHEAQLLEKQKALAKAKEVARESMVQKQKLDARGKRKQMQAGVPTIALNTLRNRAEQSTSKLKTVHTEKMEGLQQELRLLQDKPRISGIRMHFNDSTLPKGKLLFELKNAQLYLGERKIWSSLLELELCSGDRLAISGANGSGKSSMLKVMLGELPVKASTHKRAGFYAVLLDQEYSAIDNRLTIYEQTQFFNENGLAEHELKIRLNRFLFDKTSWDTSCSVLSGGEKMSLLLCCLTIRNQSPDVLLLDEPTNNLDLPNLALLSAVIADYKGTIVVVSHDSDFLTQIGVDRYLIL